MAFTRYFRDHNQLMLPRELAEDRLSLLQGEVRETVTFALDLDNHFEVTRLDIEKTRLRSEATLSYDDVGEALGTPEHPRHQQWLDALELAYGLFESHLGNRHRYEPVEKR